MRAWSSAVSATTSVPSVRSSTSIPDAFNSSAANAGQRAWLSRPSATSASSPGSASQQAASMPAAAWLAPPPAAPRSNTSTSAPLAASRHAMPTPITPAPMMATLGIPECAEPELKKLLPSLALPRQVRGCDLSRDPAAPQSVPHDNGHFGAVPQVRCQVLTDGGGVGGGGGGALRCRRNREQTIAITRITVEPRNISHSRLPCE